jgi:hypothetical protein
MPNNAPPVAFLGVAERATRVRDWGIGPPKDNILGLKQIVISPFYPTTLSGHYYAFALYGTKPEETTTCVKITADTGGAMTMNIRTSPAAGSGPGGEILEDLEQGGCRVGLTSDSWALVVLPVPAPPFVVLRPGVWKFWLSEGGEDTLIGQLTFGLVNPEPLTEARIAAIRSDPHATKAVRITFVCNNCGEQIRAYAGLERDPKSEGEGWVWYQNLPASFACSCATLTADLTSLRSNLHALLGRRKAAAGEVDLIPLYERGAMETLHANFADLLAQNAAEEVYQQFIKQNPVPFTPFFS